MDDLESRLRRPVADDRLTLHFQPIVDLPLGTVRGFEALVRWDDPQLGAVPPDEFIPVAERSDVIKDLGRWVLRTACRAAARWVSVAPAPAPSVCVNVSAVQLGDDSFVAQVKDVLSETGLDPARLCLEITETAGIGDLHETARRLVELTELGVRLSLDDFGTGYASLTVLRALPLDIVKIDRSFVTGVAGNATDAVLVRLIVDAAHALGRKVCAEGVETADQARQVTAIGADMAQGWFYGVPRPDTHEPVGRPAAVDLSGVGQRLLLGASDELVMITAHDGMIRYASANSVDILGVPSAQLIGTCDRDYLEAFVDPTTGLDRDPATVVRGSQTTLRLRHPKGSARWLASRSQVLRNDDGSVREVLSVSRDVTETMLARIALRDSDRQFTHAFDDALFGMALSTLDGRLIRVNRAFADLLGYQPQQLLEQTVASITPRGFRDEDTTNTAQLVDGSLESVDVTKRYLHAEGHQIAVRVRAVLIRSGSEEPRILAHILPEDSHHHHHRRRLRAV